MPGGHTPVGGEFRVSSDPEYSQYHHAVAALANGGFVVTADYHDGQDGSLWGIFGQRYDANGRIVGSEFQVNSYALGFQSDPSVTGLADGGFVATWTSNGQDRGRSDGVYGQLYDDNGVAVGGEFRVNSFTQNNQYDSQVAALSDGSFVVTWTSLNQIGENSEIYGQRFAADGEATGAEFRINTHVSNSQSYNDITSLADGGFVVTWSSYDQSLGELFYYDWDVFGQRFDANGIAIGPEFLINSHTAERQIGASVTALTDGGFLVTWSSQIPLPSSPVSSILRTVVLGQRYDATGAAVGSEFVISHQHSSYHPEVAGLPDGGFVVFYHSSETGVRVDGEGVFGQRFDADGMRVGTAFLVNTYAEGDQEAPSVAVLSDGSFVVTWRSEEQEVGETEWGVFGQRYAAELWGTRRDDSLTDNVGANWMQGRGGDDVLIGNGGRDRIIGDDGNDLLNGGVNHDHLTGGSGNDVLLGQAGDDRLGGGSGDDRLYGKTGDDVLVGGTGRDWMVGGVGADIFRFRNAAEAGTTPASFDRIAGFNQTEGDLIDLSAIDANPESLGDQPFIFIGAAGFSGVAGELRYKQTDVNTVVEVDMDGDGIRDFGIVLRGVVDLAAGDFLL